VARALPRVLTLVALVLAAGLLTQPAAATEPELHVVSTGATVGTPVPGAHLTADLGTWEPPGPESYTFEWLRDGIPIPGALTQDYLVQAADVGHQVAPRVTGHRSGYTTAGFTADALTVRKIGSSLSLDVRRTHPPGQHRLVWTAITFITTERPWGTDGGTVTAFRVKDGRLKELGSALMARSSAFVRLPWKRAPLGRTRVVVCYGGSDVVESSCSPFDVVRRHPDDRGR
jgi:hypothetical protein